MIEYGAIDNVRLELSSDGTPYAVAHDLPSTTVIDAAQLVVHSLFGVGLTLQATVLLSTDDRIAARLDACIMELDECIALVRSLAVARTDADA